MNEKIIYQHLGLGDHFVCNGLVNILSQRYDKVYLPCKKSYYETVNYMFSINPKVHVVKIMEEEQEVFDLSERLDIPVLKIGHENHSSINWDRSFYQQYDIAFEERYNSFKLPLCSNIYRVPLPDEDFIVVHNEASIGNFDININTNLKTIYITKDLCDNMFSLIDLFYVAKEIHCIDSSVFHFVDSIKLFNSKLFYHNVRKNNQNYFQPDSKWNIVNYENS